MSPIALLIKQLKAASAQSSDGSVNATIDATWRFAATVNFERDDIESLDEESLREALGEQVEELTAQFDASEAIEVGEILNLKDGGNDDEIPLPPSQLKYELTLRGFNGDTDATDDHVLAVKTSMSEEELTAFIASDAELRIDIHGIAPLPDTYSDDAIDFHLPEDLVALRVRISMILAD